MLSNRKRDRGSWPNIKVLASYNLAASLPYRGNKLSPAQIAFLAAVHLETMRSNDYCRLSVAVGMVGKNVIGWTGIKKLRDLGLLQAPMYGRYVVSAEAEYFLRDIETLCARIVGGKPFSKWRKIRGENDLRSKFVRGNQKATLA